MQRRAAGWAVAVASALAPMGCSAQADGVLAEGPSAPVRSTTACTVTRVVDGDTLECESLGRVRLIGMDTPERAQEPFGGMSTEALQALIPTSGEVFVEADVEDRDPFDRALRYVWVDGLLLNWAMVRTGHAVILTYAPNVQYVDWLMSAQDAAREEGAGLWSLDGFACPPLEYRRGSCR